MMAQDQDQPLHMQPFASPMVGDGAAASPIVSGDWTFSSAVGTASFSPAYSPESGSY